MIGAIADFAATGAVVGAASALFGKREWRLAEWTAFGMVSGGSWAA